MRWPWQPAKPMFKSFGWPEWDEVDYQRLLNEERHLFAWCLVHLGKVETSLAATLAERRYPFERKGKPYRGLIFHDPAWHYAMIALYGDMYWKAHPELERMSPEYNVEAERIRREPPPAVA